MNDSDKLKLYELYKLVYGSLDGVEWSGIRQGQGWGPMGSGNDGTEYPACPVCGGLKEPNGEFIAEAVGHQPGCALAAALGKPTRPLKPGEQGRMPL